MYGEMMKNQNIDQKVVNDFGEEWKKFDQNKGFTVEEKRHHFNDYFKIFPWSNISKDAVGFDAGCGSGRWASLVLPKVGHLHCIDPSIAINVAKKNLVNFKNCTFHKCAIHEMPIKESSMDFGYSLGVLHHMPDPEQGLRDCVKTLKAGAPFLVYLYYALDNQPLWYRLLWRVSDIFRKIICLMPRKLKNTVTSLIAFLVYYPFSRTAYIAEKFGISIHSWPLSNYRDKSFYTMRTDALDRFGTRLEHRFTKSDVISMMEMAGLSNIVISDSVPYYCAVGIKK